ncbi:MAG: LacI family DNA-binding transcriptional regulator, partial [Oscillospiraceae bacterium]|nr:LacI family DNA-binding transcriptional regulator [Oscillospiraceae bacterium]
RLIVLPGKYDDESSEGWLHCYRSVHNRIFALSEICGFDGVIVHLGSMSKNVDTLLKSRAFDRMRNKPKVFIGLDDPELVTVNYDNDTGIAETVNYLVNIKGLRKLCMLGGREDNKDACKRRDIFFKHLAENNIAFGMDNFVNSDMTENCLDSARQLLDANPGAEAVFCVNDASAKALYTVMDERHLVPGKDILVFGFDNTSMSSEIVPSLASIGADGSSLGQRALELLIMMINGEEAQSAFVPTRLFGGDSLPYEMYDYTTLEMINIDTAFVYRMFDDCFYRYRTSCVTSDMIDLKRLFFEFISKMLLAMKRRYMSVETFERLCRLIDIFFENGATKYTDASKLINSIDRLQNSMNNAQPSIAARIMINRLFQHMKDRSILAYASELSEEKDLKRNELMRLQDFTAASMGYDITRSDPFQVIVRCIGILGSENAALYMFDRTPAQDADDTVFPQYTDLKCVVRDGHLHIIPEQRQRCRLSDIFARNDLPKKNQTFIVFPVFHLGEIYGLLLCSPDPDIYDRGEYIALELGRALYLNSLCE